MTENEEDLTIDVWDDSLRPADSSIGKDTSIPTNPYKLLDNTDAFTQQFANSVDDLMQSFKAQAMQSFLLTEKAMQKTHWAEMKAQETSYEQVVADKNLQLESASNTRLQLGRELEIKNNRIDKLIHLSRRLRNSQYGRHLIISAMLRWRLYRRINADEKVQNNFVRRHYTHRLARAVWQEWTRYTRSTVLKRQFKSLESKKDVERAAIIQDATLERERLGFCVKELTEKLEQETLAKKNIQENLKTVFMRGVCALNFEAMSLLDNKPLEEIAAAPLAVSAQASTHEMSAQELNTTHDFKESMLSDTRGGRAVPTSPNPRGTSELHSHLSTPVSPPPPLEQSRKFEPHPLPFVTYTQPKPVKKTKWIDAPVKRVC